MARQTLLEVMLASASLLTVLPATDGWKADRVQDVLNTVVSVSGTMLGFVIAAVSILATITEKPVIERLRKTGHFANLLHDFLIAAAWMGSAMLISGAGLFSLDEQGYFWLAVASAMFCGGVIRLSRAGKNFYLLIGIL